MKVLYYGDTNVGNIRPKNEDAFVLKEVWGGTHLIAVCVDGVGGNGGGDVAANLACKCITDYFNDLNIQTDCLESLISAVRFANNTICSEHYIPYLSQMSCVLTAALINLEEGCYEKGISCDLLCGRQWNDWFLCQSVEYSSWMCVFHPWCCLACWFNHSGVQTG